MSSFLMNLVPFENFHLFNLSAILADVIKDSEMATRDKKGSN